MKALTWHAKRYVRVETVPDPTIQEPTDAIVAPEAYKTFQEKADGAVKVLFEP